MQPDFSNWASWLSSIAHHPQQHDHLVQVKDQIRYITSKESKHLQKEGTPVQLLTLHKIIEVTRNIWQDPSVTQEQKKNTWEGISYIHEQRQAKYQNLWWITKCFAKLRGVEAQLKSEKEAIEQLNQRLSTGQSDPILSQDVPMKDAEVLVEFSVIRQQLMKLIEKKKQKGAGEGTSLDEEFFQMEITLQKLRKTFSKSLQQTYKTELKQLDQDLDKWNKEMPRVKQLVKVLGEDVLRSTLKETLDSICKNKALTEVQKKRDQILFNCSELQVQALYVKRLIKANRTDLSLSLITAIERTWKEILNKGQQEATTKILEGKRVIFDPNPLDPGIYIKEGFIANGTYKAAFMLTFFHDVKKEKERGIFTILQPIDAVIDEFTEEEQLPEEKKERAQAAASVNSQVEKQGSSSQDWGETSKVNDAVSLGAPLEYYNLHLNEDSPQEVREHHVKESKLSTLAEKEEEYQQEAENCLKYGHLPGIWPTHKIITVDGQVAIIQKTAGYLIKTDSKEKKYAISLEDMAILFQEKKLLLQDQLLFLKMIGDSLTGVDSLHKVGVIHRDLKPANILCSSEGNAGVSDFGTVCLNQIPTKTEKNQVSKMISNPQKEGAIGSPYYIAPEVISYNNNNEWSKIDLAADIWSVGIILWSFLLSESAEKHPAFDDIRNISHANRMVMKSGDILSITANNQKYNKRYPEPTDKTSLAHLVWSCTRAEPSLRPKISEVIQRYQQWAEETATSLKTGEVQSIQENLNKIVTV